MVHEDSALSPRRNEQVAEAGSALAGMVIPLEPRPPIFVIDRDGGDLLAFETVVAAAGFMEPPEVKEGAYLVFDADAHEAVPGVRGWDVELASWSPDPRQSELRALLVGFLSEHEIDLGSDARFDDVVGEAAEVARRLDADRIRPRFVSRWRPRRT